MVGMITNISDRKDTKFLSYNNTLSVEIKFHWQTGAVRFFRGRHRTAEESNCAEYSMIRKRGLSYWMMKMSA